MTTRLGRLVDKRRAGACAIALAMCASGPAHAGWYNDGKVLATGGVITVDGAGGGGITPWATISGYETRDGINGGLHYTWVYLPNYSLNSYGATLGFFDRVELSYTNSTLPTGSTFDTVGLAARLLSSAVTDTGVKPFNTTIKMDVYGVKIRLFGEAIYDSDNLIPQVAIGGFYKNNHNDELLKTLQAAKAKDWEAYICATKIFFPINTLINATVRYTSANETGLTGFGTTGDNKKKFRPEVSVAYLLAKNTAIGGEYQKHGRNLDGKRVQLEGVDLTQLTPLLGGTGDTLTQRESDWFDLFFAYLPNKNLSFTLAYAMLGDITITPNQNGFYFSMHATF